MDSAATGWTAAFAAAAVGTAAGAAACCVTRNVGWPDVERLLDAMTAPAKANTDKRNKKPTTERSAVHDAAEVPVSASRNLTRWHSNDRRSAKKRPADDCSCIMNSVQGYPLARAMARLAFARVLMTFTAYEQDPSRTWSVLRKHLVAAEIAEMLGPKLAIHASALAAAGYGVSKMWSRVAVNRKQKWLSDVGLAGAELRPTRQSIIDAVNRHRTAHAPDHVCTRPLKRPNLLSIVDEKQPLPRDAAALYPNATILDTLPPVYCTDSTCNTDIGWKSLRFGVRSHGGPSKAYCSSDTAWLVDTLADAVCGCADSQCDTSMWSHPQLVMVVGPIGSGKTTLLHAVGEAAANRLGIPYDPTTDGTVSWNHSAAIISQFGGAEEAKGWLGGVGLSSVPQWCQAHHTLSTGQAYRANLARRLQDCCRHSHFFTRSSTNHSHQHRSVDNCNKTSGIERTKVTSAPLLLDDFGAPLDRLTAAVCTAALAKQLRSMLVGTLVTASHCALAPWLQPDLLVILSVGDKANVRHATVLRNQTSVPLSNVAAKCGSSHVDLGPIVTVEIDPYGSHASPERASSSAKCNRVACDGLSNSLYKSESGRRTFALGLPVMTTWRKITPSFEFDPARESGLDAKDRTVLRSEINMDDATRACDAFFDTAFDGTNLFAMPAFPSFPELETWLSKVVGQAGWTQGQSSGIGVIVGPSGSSKSAILRRYFSDDQCRDLSTVTWDPNLSISRQVGLPAIPASPGEPCAAEVLAVVGLSAIGDRIVSELSRSQRWLADVAQLLGTFAAAASGNSTTISSVNNEQLDGVHTPEAHMPLSLTLTIDEFGGTLDGATARRVAVAIGSFFARHRPPSGRNCICVLATCNAEFLQRSDTVSENTRREGLLPDWIFITDKAELHIIDRAAAEASALGKNVAIDAVPLPEGVPADMKSAGLEIVESVASQQTACAGEVKIPRPKVALRLRECPANHWRRFREHHYKTPVLSTSARCFVLELPSAAAANALGAGLSAEDYEVGFVATIVQTESRGARGTSLCKDYDCRPKLLDAVDADKPRPAARRAHRTVVLPQWQGIGVGSRLSDAIAEWHRLEGCTYTGQTVHPRFGQYRDRSPLWWPTIWNHTTQRLKIESWVRRLPTSLQMQPSQRESTFVITKYCPRLVCTGYVNQAQVKQNTKVRLRTPRYVYSHRYIGAGPVPSRSDLTLAPTKRQGDDTVSPYVVQNECTGEKAVDVELDADAARADRRRYLDSRVVIASS